MIKTLTALNVKGRDFIHSFTKLNIISGPNFRGKTAILDAIKLAILGFVPELGRTGKANFQLAGGESNVISADLEMSDGSHLTRRLEMVKGSVKSTGTDPVEMPLLTPEEYFQMTDKARREYVAARFGGGLGITVEEIIAGMERHSFGDEHTEEVETAKPTVIGIVKNFLVRHGNISDLIGLAIEGLKEEYSAANAKAKDTAGAVRTLSELKAKEQNFDRVDALQDQIALTEKELAEANRAYGDLIGQRRGAQTAQDRAEKLRKLLAGETPDYGKEIEELTASLPPVENADHMEKEFAEFTACKRKMEEELAGMVSQRRDIEDRLVDSEKNLADLEHLKSCPFCKSNGKGWDQTLRGHYDAVIAKAKAELERLEGQISTFKQTIADADKKIADLTREIEAIHANANIRTKNLARIETLKAGMEAAKKERASWQEQLDAITEVDIPDEQDIAAAQTKSNDLLVTVNALKARLAAAIGIQNDIKRAAESAEANKKHAAMMTVIKAYGKKLTEIQAEAVSGVFTEMLVIANRIAEGILLSPIAYHEGEIGRWDNGRFIGHGTFSGTERTITYSAIAAALSSNAKDKIMLIDELSRLTPIMQSTLMGRLEECVEEKVIDQVILVAPSDRPITVEGWNNITIS